VLLTGESGTGKDLAAKVLHYQSDRAARPFMNITCSALPETILESELFGHMRGSFTGAFSDKKGVFEEAQGGTCFLDEIGGISPHMQARLLRVLQEHEIRRVGGKEWLPVDVRVLAATNQDLSEAVAKGQFRQDLYYRLDVVTVQLPPLRQRADDIPLLAYHFLRYYSQDGGKPVAALSDKAMELLSAYHWPGNIRELEHAIEQAVALSYHPVLTPEDLPAEVREQKANRFPAAAASTALFNFPDTPSLEEVKKRYVRHVLQLAEGNVSATARILNVDRRSLYRMLARYKIGPMVKND
jgi:two-component system, NtrC family, response regulator AtoC